MKSDCERERVREEEEKEGEKGGNPETRREESLNY